MGTKAKAFDVRSMQRAVTDRFAVIRPYVEHGVVMDLGCVDARAGRDGAAGRIARKPDHLFRRIMDVNSTTVGVDIDAEGVEELARQGYPIRRANVETMNLDLVADVVVAGEIIEHLENPGVALRNMHRHLRPGGKLILSTPNPFAALRLWKILRYGKPSVHREHTCWFDPVTLDQLLRRTGFETVGGCWIQPPGMALRSWPRLIREFFSHSFMLVAQAIRNDATDYDTERSNGTQAAPARKAALRSCS